MPAPAPLARPAAAAVLLAGLLTACAGGGGTPPPEIGHALTVRSAAIDQEGTWPDRHTCTDEDVSPPLSWTDVPPEAEELAILLEDPDAPGETFVHWVGAGIDPAAAGLDEGEAPPLEGTNDFGSRGYRGPCPPEGDAPHRYVLTVFASDRPLGLAPGATAEDLRTALEDAEVARGQLTARYARP